jgi:hypothetical protein
MIGTCDLIMDDRQLRTLEQVKQFVDSSQGIEFNGLNLKEKYHWTEEALKKFKYPRLKKAGKGLGAVQRLGYSGYLQRNRIRLENWSPEGPR